MLSKMGSTLLRDGGRHAFDWRMATLLWGAQAYGNGLGLRGGEASRVGKPLSFRIGDRRNNDLGSALFFHPDWAY